MFERFTDRGRRVIVLAQEEARGLDHNFIGTDHLLLGLIGVREGIAAEALDACGITAEAVRDRVRELVPPTEPLSGHIPFTPVAKKAIEQALRESMKLGHSWIGPEHLLLGVLVFDDKADAPIFEQMEWDRVAVRSKVLDLCEAMVGPPPRTAPTRSVDEMVLLLTRITDAVERLSPPPEGAP